MESVNQPDETYLGTSKGEVSGSLGLYGRFDANPKDLKSLVYPIPFPKNLRSMQSFIGSLNYYSRFIEDFAIYALVLYELREADLYEISCDFDGLGVYSGNGDDSDRIKGQILGVKVAGKKR